MDPSDVAFVKGVITFVLVAGTFAGIFRMWLRARYGSSPRTERLVEGLRDDNAQLRADFDARIAELEERVDFAERRLVQERSSPPRRDSTARTPV